jgi:hypothetical protein
MNYGGQVKTFSAVPTSVLKQRQRAYRCRDNDATVAATHVTIRLLLLLLHVLLPSYAAMQISTATFSVMC